MHSHIKPLFLLSALAVSACICPAHAEDKPDEPKSTHFNLNLAQFDDPSSSDITFGVQWDIGWKYESDWQRIALSSTGAWAIDESLNHTPLIAQLNAGGHIHLAGGIVKPGSGDPLKDPLSDGALRANDAPLASIGMLWGVTGRYESDQAWDHRNGVASAFLGLNNTNHRNAWSLIPSLYLSADAVFPDQNSTAGGDLGNYGRFYAAANWEINLGLLDHQSDFLERLRIHTSLEYQNAFGAPQALKQTGQDSGFGVLAELIFKACKDIGINDHAKTPLYIFAQFTSGRFAPQPEDEQRLIAGVRFEF